MNQRPSLEILNKHLTQLTFQRPRNDKNSNMSPAQLTQLLTTFETFGTLVILFPNLIPNHQDKLRDLLSLHDKEDGFWKYNKTISEKSHFTFQYELMIKPSVLCTSILNTVSINFPRLLGEMLPENIDDILKDTIHNITNWIRRFHYRYVNHQLIDWWNILLWITRRLHASNTLKSPHSQAYKEFLISLFEQHLEEETKLPQKSSLGSLITFQEIYWRLTGKFLNLPMEFFKDDPLLNILAHKKLLAKWLQSPQLMFEDLIWLPYPELSIPKSELSNIKKAITIIAKRMNTHNADRELNLNILICRIQQARISR